jgi:hypothetical protein
MINSLKGKSLKWSIIGLALIALIGIAYLIYPKPKTSNTAASKDVETALDGISPESFLKLYGLKITGNAEKFDVIIPSNWNVNAGDYPVGLYWELANEFSKDAGLDLTKLKGTTVKAWRYTLTDGLPGLKEQSNFNYPSTVVLLVNSNKVAGAWLNFNIMTIGPSVKKGYLNDITGLTFEEWVYKKGLFANLKENADLEALSPVDLLKAYFKAIKDGNKTRAYACLSPKEMLDSLTMNYRGQGLYNDNFNLDNSQVENIIDPEPLSFKLFDSNNPAVEVKEIENRTEIEIAVTMKIKWRDNAFNSPDEKQVRFAILNKYKNGWKLGGFGTGP